MPSGVNLESNIGRAFLYAKGKQRGQTTFEVFVDLVDTSADVDVGANIYGGL